MSRANRWSDADRAKFLHFVSLPDRMRDSTDHVYSETFCAVQSALQTAHEYHRLSLVAALHLPLETTWEEALARVVPVVVRAKGCHGCRFANSLACERWTQPEVAAWILRVLPLRPALPVRVHLSQVLQRPSERVRRVERTSA